jgi:hypothetical protein
MSKALCVTSIAQSSSSPSPLTSAFLSTPLLTARLSSGGVDGDEYSIHTLWLWCSQAASAPYLQSLAEYTANAMYEVLLGYKDEETEDDAPQPGHAYAAHALMATLSPASFLSVSITHTALLSHSLLVLLLTSLSAL